MSAFTLSSAEQLDRLIAHSVTAGFSYQAEIYREVRAGRIASVQFERNAIVPMKPLKHSALPVVVIIGDDDYASTGPSGWASFPNLVRWARGAMIHASGGDIASYRMAIGMAMASKRFLLIETDFAHMRQWGDALLNARRPVPFIALRPSNGVHPVLPARESVQ